MFLNCIVLKSLTFVIFIFIETRIMISYIDKFHEWINRLFLVFVHICVFEYFRKNLRTRREMILQGGW